MICPRILGTLFLLFALLVSCEEGQVVTLSKDYGERVFVAEDRETAESLIDSFISGKCSQPDLMRSLSSGRVFSVGAGRKVLILEGGCLTRTRKIRILEGRSTDRAGWVSETMLRPIARNGRGLM